MQGVHIAEKCSKVYIPNLLMIIGSQVSNDVLGKFLSVVTVLYILFLSKI